MQLPPDSSEPIDPSACTNAVAPEKDVDGYVMKFFHMDAYSVIRIIASSSVQFECQQVDVSTENVGEIEYELDCQRQHLTYDNNN